jgi:hypothetical protein
VRLNRICLPLVVSGLAVAALTGCGSSTPKSAAPPSPASLAAKLGCHIEWPDTEQLWAYDTVAQDDMSGGMCSDGTISSVYADVITFKSAADQQDWLHQNAMVESSSNPTGFAELVVGNLWAVGEGGVFTAQPVINAIGGQDVSF